LQIVDLNSKIIKDLKLDVQNPIYGLNACDSNAEFGPLSQMLAGLIYFIRFREGHIYYK